MKISIVTINYNNSKALQATFDSVFCQTVQDFEYIVIDGGSSDGSKELIELHNDRFSFWASEPDKGIYHAINKGISKAKGEYILCLNSGDCLYNKTVIEEVLPFLSRDIDIVYGDAACTNYLDRPDDIWHIPHNLVFDYFTVGALCHQATFIKRELFSKIGLYEEGFKIASDWFFTLKAFTYFSATYHHLGFVVCTFDKSGISATQLELANSERKFILEKYFSFFRKQKIVFQISDLTIKKMLKMILPYGLVRVVQKHRVKTYWDFSS